MNELTTKPAGVAESVFCMQAQNAYVRLFDCFSMIAGLGGGQCFM